MSEIPDDINATADRLACISGIATRADHIAQAILAERHRQAEVMEEVKKEARRRALEEAAILVEAHPMRFAGQNERYVRRSMAEAVRALSTMQEISTK
ncbi:hypothetical protein [Rhizobium sp. No.120]